MYVVTQHALEPAGGDDRRVEGVVGAVDDGGRDITGCDSDGGEEGDGGDGDAVALVGADEVVGRVGVFSGVREGRDGRVEF
jgi:hypothetical protein